MCTYFVRRWQMILLHGHPCGWNNQYIINICKKCFENNKLYAKIVHMSNFWNVLNRVTSFPRNVWELIYNRNYKMMLSIIQMEIMLELVHIALVVSGASFQRNEFWERSGAQLIRWPHAHNWWAPLAGTESLQDWLSRVAFPLGLDTNATRRLARIFGQGETHIVNFCPCWFWKYLGICAMFIYLGGTHPRVSFSMFVYSTGVQV